MALFDYYNDHGFTYNQAFAYQYALKALLLAVCCMSGSIIFYFASKFVKSTSARSSLIAEDQEQEENYNPSYANVKSFLNSSEKPPNDHTQTMITALETLSIIGSWLTIFSFAIIPGVLSGLDVISTPAAVVLTILIFLLKYIAMIYWYCPAFLKKRTATTSQAEHFFRKVKTTTGLYKFRFISFFVFGLAYSFVVPHLTQDMCLNFYNEGYGSNYQGIGVSTRFSRYFQIKTVCPKGEICQVYATLPEETSTGVIFNVHTGPDVSSIKLQYKKEKGEEKEETVVAQSYFLDLEERGARYVHSSYISGLEPATVYTIDVLFNDKLQKTVLYKTMPSEKMEQDMIIAAGGDAGTTRTAKQMTSVLGKYNLDAIIVGGDVSYDNGMPSCYYSMDLFLRMFEDVYQKVGRIVPMMFSIGNHDIGFNAFQDGKVDITKNMYYIFFPQETKKNKEGKLVVPDLHERNSYSYHAMGNTVHLALDSGYMLRYDGLQEDFIKNISEKYHDRVKMANFHVPMAPTCFSELYDDIRTITDAQKYWAPLFEKYKFASVFENHVHLYKKTYPLTNGAKNITDKGVVYFGDGNWGINPNQCSKDPRNLNYTGTLESMSNTTHIWLISVTKTELVHYAVDKNGERFDKEYPFEVNDYVTEDVKKFHDDL